MCELSVFIQLINYYTDREPKDNNLFFQQKQQVTQHRTDQQYQVWLVKRLSDE